MYLILEKSIVYPLSPVTGFPGINFIHVGLGVGAVYINKFLFAKLNKVFCIDVAFLSNSITMINNKLNLKLK